MRSRPSNDRYRPECADRVGVLSAHRRRPDHRAGSASSNRWVRPIPSRRRADSSQRRNIGATREVAVGAQRKTRRGGMLVEKQTGSFG